MWYIAKERPSNYKPKTHFKEVVATLSKKNEMGAYTRYVTISFFEDKEANAFYYSERISSNLIAASGILVPGPKIAAAPSL